MIIQLNDTVFTLPHTLAEYTLSQRIAFQQAEGNLLDEMAVSIQDMPDGLDKDFETIEFNIEKAYRSFSFFSGVSLEVLKESDFGDYIVNTYLDCLQNMLFEEQMLTLEHEFAWNKEQWILQPYELHQGSLTAFGELVDSKQLIKDKEEAQANKWEILLPLSAIFLRRQGEEYQEAFLYDNSERLKLMSQLPLNIAMNVGLWFEKFSDYTSEHFPVFWPGKGKSGAYAKRHFSRWGWVNFLKGIAKEKVFDLPGSSMNSIQCARIAKAFDVLVYASEEKEYIEATNADLEILYKKNK